MSTRCPPAHVAYDPTAPAPLDAPPPKAPPDNAAAADARRCWVCCTYARSEASSFAAPGAQLLLPSPLPPLPL